MRDAFFGRLCYLRDDADEADENLVVFVLNEDQPTWPPSREVPRECDAREADACACDRG